MTSKYPDYCKEGGGGTGCRGGVRVRRGADNSGGIAAKELFLGLGMVGTSGSYRVMVEHPIKVQRDHGLMA